MQHPTGTPVSTPTSTRPASRGLFIVITMQNEEGTTGTTGHQLTASVGASHADLMTHVIATLVPEHLRSGIVLHYSVHPAVIA